MGFVALLNELVDLAWSAGASGAMLGFAGVAVGSGAVAWALWRVGGHSLESNGAIIVAAWCATAALVVAVHSGSAKSFVADYCAYGSQSKRQLEGCKDHVVGADVRD